MPDPIFFNPGKELNELTNQLSISRRIGFFLGAGVSAALGLPDIHKLTQQVESGLAADEKLKIDKIKNCLAAHSPGSVVTVEDILNQIRLIRLLTKESDAKAYETITGAEAKNLDKTICLKICEVISAKEKTTVLLPIERFASWLNWLNRDFTKEIFTTNYDLIVERSLENLQIPYFDGFVGGNEAFFYPESIEQKNKLELLPLSWIRLWKLHGSFGWFWKKNMKINGSYKVVRLGVLSKPSEENTGELVIYPSREKYESSRKQPFITYFDRLSAYLQDGEGLFIISGYSFSDQHINQIIFNSLKQNNRLHVVAFLFDDNPIKIINEQIATHMNLSVYGPTQTIIGGRLGKWLPGEDKTEGASNRTICGLGDFNKFVEFLIESSGKKIKIEEDLAKAK